MIPTINYFKLRSNFRTNPLSASYIHVASSNAQYISKMIGWMESIRSTKVVRICYLFRTFRACSFLPLLWKQFWLHDRLQHNNLLSSNWQESREVWTMTITFYGKNAQVTEKCLSDTSFTVPKFVSMKYQWELTYSKHKIKPKWIIQDVWNDCVKLKNSFKKLM